MKPYTFPTMDELTEVLCNNFHKHMARLNIHKKQINLALPGGKTPVAFFDRLAANQRIPEKSTDWSRVHIFWVDERCVAPGHPDSNYTMAEKWLLHAIDLNESQIHRIRGENEPIAEAIRYEAEIRQAFHQPEGIPAFDWIFLGLGEDGHTASIFPDRLDLLHSGSVSEAVLQPGTGQYRVTLTGPVIMQADRITYLVTGSSKSIVVRQIINNEPVAEGYPANYIWSVKGKVHWYLDSAASMQLNI